MRELPEIAVRDGKAHCADSAIFLLLLSICEFTQTDTPSALIFCSPFSGLHPLKEIILLWLQYPKAI